MKTVIHVSLSGHAKTFQLEEEAYKALQAYLDRAQAPLRGDDRVVSRKEVEVVLDEIGAVNTGNGDAAADTTAFDRPRRFCRIDEGKWFFGVCQGLSAYSDIAVEWVRVIFIIGTFFTGGALILLYLLLAFLMPQVRDRREYDASLRSHAGAA